jgi:uncharacterized DUF497 family protein
MAFVYEWDDQKAASNLEKHGVEFEYVTAFDWDTALLLPSTGIHAEERYQTIGVIGDRLFVLVFTLRAQSCRVISLRRANSREYRLYEKT